MNELLNAALEHAKQGRPVIPLHTVYKDGRCSCGKKECSSPGKHPRTKNGLKDATTDPTLIESWWTAWPDANLGLLTGQPSNTVTLDVDERHGGEESLEELTAEHGELPITPQAKTGGGRHIFFKHPGNAVRNSAKVRPGIDVRGDGGYVVAAPSLHASGKVYFWLDGMGLGEIPLAPMPAWLLTLVTKKAKPTVPISQFVQPAVAGQSTPYGLAALAAECGKLASMLPDSGRNDQLNRAAFAAGQLVAGGELDKAEAEQALLEAARSCGLPEPELLRTVERSLKEGMAQPRRAPERLAAPHPYTAHEKTEQENSHRDDGPVLRCLADVEPREVQWLWPGRVPLGRITLLVGRPGEGKSFLTTDMAARVTTGRAWPDGAICPSGAVIFVSAEDDPADTIRPRLDAHHADVRRIHLLSAVRRLAKDGAIHEVMFTLADVGALESTLLALPDCRMIVVDPIGSFLGGNTDAHRDNEVRSVLAPVALLAEKYGVAVVVVAHRRKGTGTSADDLALGSRAFTGIARAVWHLSRDPQDKGRRCFLPGKNNLAPEGDGLAFTIDGEPPAIIWEDLPVTMSADDALAIENENGRGNKSGPEPAARNEAAEWLRNQLKAETPVAKVREESTAAGYAWRTVQRAADSLGVVRRPCGSGRGWTWDLPFYDANRRCQPPQEENNLATWHPDENTNKNDDSVCQDTEDAKLIYLGTSTPDEAIPVPRSVG